MWGISNRNKWWDEIDCSPHPKICENHMMNSEQITITALVTSTRFSPFLCIDVLYIEIGFVLEFLNGNVVAGEIRWKEIEEKNCFELRYFCRRVCEICRENWTSWKSRKYFIRNQFIYAIVDNLADCCIREHLGLWLCFANQIKRFCQENNDFDLKIEIKTDSLLPFSTNLRELSIDSSISVLPLNECHL